MPTEPVGTPLADALEAERIQAAKEAEADAAFERAEAAKLATAQGVLASGKVEALVEAQAQVEKLIDSFIEWTDHAHALQAEVTEARDVVATLGGGDAPVIPVSLALRASVGGDHKLRVKLERFRTLALSGAEA